MKILKFLIQSKEKFMTFLNELKLSLKIDNSVLLFI